MTRVRQVTKELKKHDSCLYAQETKPGRIDIYRESKFSCNPPHFLFSLTDTWKPTGRPVEYGLLVIMDRIRALDLWNNTEFMENYIKTAEKEKESKDRSRRNNIEAFLYDFRSQFAKATDSINTSLL